MTVTMSLICSLFVCCTLARAQNQEKPQTPPFIRPKPASSVPS